MNVQILIDSIVRQTTVLIAELATSGGVRAPLARVANQVFLELSDELFAQGVSRKISADMLGFAVAGLAERGVGGCQPRYDVAIRFGVFGAGEDFVREGGLAANQGRTSDHLVGPRPSA